MQLNTVYVKTIHHFVFAKFQLLWCRGVGLYPKTIKIWYFAYEFDQTERSYPLCKFYKFLHD